VIIDAEGNELLDFAGGIGVMNAGHCQDAVVEAITRQAGRLLHTCFHVATYEPYVELAEKLAQLLPHGEHTKVLLINSGAEAVENAVKIARQATGRSAVICYSEAFHGRTLMGMSLTSKVGTRRGAVPSLPRSTGFLSPTTASGATGWTMEAFVERELDRLRESFNTMVAAQDVAAIIIEPVQGEGGFVPAPPGYLRGLREICDQEGIVLVFDEVQTGFCRTGRWAAYEHFGVLPDLSTWAKSMGGGLPIGAVVGRAEVMDGAEPGTIGGTYGGNPVACASALATIRIMEELDLNRRATEIGRTIRRRFEALAQRCGSVGEVRGLGAMMAMELVDEGDPHRPAGAGQGGGGGLPGEGVLVITAGPAGNVIRILSPLVITDEELDRGLASSRRRCSASRRRRRWSGGPHRVPAGSPRVRPIGVAGLQLRISGHREQPGLPVLEAGPPHGRLPLGGDGGVQRAGRVRAFQGPGRTPSRPRRGRVPRDGPEARLWLVTGSLYEKRRDGIYNTASVLNPEGEVVGRHRKLFPFTPYEAGVEAGEEFLVFDVPEVGRFGVSICYDSWVPETSRTLVAMGAEVILHPSLTGTIDRDVELAIARSTAATNQCYFVDINGVGAGGVGTSILVGPHGEIIHQAGDGEELIPVELDLDRVRRSRERGLRGLGQPLKSFRDRKVRFRSTSAGGRVRGVPGRPGPLEKPGRPPRGGEPGDPERPG
jgi:4-aminobutyrate aminotransferase / (S)-3-amino-2-methylpropionate transaminase / 5-aminovalerate transaminase